MVGKAFTAVLFSFLWAYGFCASLPGTVKDAVLDSRASSLPCGAITAETYTVVTGDTLTSIAAKFHSGICDIAKLNGIANPNVIDSGQTLKIPLNCIDPDNTSCLGGTGSSPTNQTCASGPIGFYIIKAGDTQQSIATLFGLKVSSLAAANPSALFSVGDVINIPVCPNISCTVATYTIKAGDTFYLLAQTYKTTVGEIEMLNLEYQPTALQPGQQILLPTGCTPTKGSCS